MAISTTITRGVYKQLAGLGGNSNPGSSTKADRRSAQKANWRPAQGELTREGSQRGG